MERVKSWGSDVTVPPGACRTIRRPAISRPWWWWLSGCSSSPHLPVGPTLQPWCDSSPIGRTFQVIPTAQNRQGRCVRSRATFILLPLTPIVIWNVPPVSGSRTAIYITQERGIPASRTHHSARCSSLNLPVLLLPNKFSFCGLNCFFLFHHNTARQTRRQKQNPTWSSLGATIRWRRAMQHSLTDCLEWAS